MYYFLGPFLMKASIDICFFSFLAAGGAAAAAAGGAGLGALGAASGSFVVAVPSVLASVGASSMTM